MLRSLLVSLCCLVIPVVAEASGAADGPDGVARLLSRLEDVLQSGTPSRYAGLLSGLAEPQGSAAFATQMVRPGVRRAVVRERDRVPMDGTLPGDGYSVIVEVLQQGDRLARLSTWRLDVRRPSSLAAGPAQAVSDAEGPDEWRIANQKVISELPLLHHLELDRSAQLVGRDIVITAPDLRMVVPSATLFIAQAGGGPTAVVVLGRGEMRFSPAPAAERGQVRIFSGADSLLAPFEALVLHMSPSEFRDHVSGTLVSQPADPAALEQAEEAFRLDGARSYVLDLGDLSSDAWSLLPGSGDFIAEIRTRRFGTLTYARAANDAEDISLFDRATRRNIAVYASPEQLASRGRFYSEDDGADFRVTSYDIDAAFEPAARRIEGRAQLKITVRAPLIKTLTLRLADALNVTSAASDELGRLLAVRVRHQNSVVLNLPSAMPQDATFSVTLSYSGTLSPQAIDQEALGQFSEREQVSEDIPLIESYLYSNRSYWYPQATTTDYATARLRLHVPTNYGCVASGRLVETLQAGAGRKAGARRFTFIAAQPVRYLACLITPLVHAASSVLRLTKASASGAAAGQYEDVTLAIKTSPRLQHGAPALAITAREILSFYAALLGDSPYPDETVAAVERRLPGGHSPAYMAVLNQPLPGSRVSWRDDPASFDQFPEFFMAHELAHQWWGQAVGWKNYHEQWLSEGLAQYFAALYAERAHGHNLFDAVVRRFRDSTMQKSGQGPIYLGYRIGHIKGDSRAFRAIVYNKGALVLHMLRRLVGDEAFYAGLRRFYVTWRFRKAGSDDLRRAMEAAAGRDLGRFFQRWVYDDALPVITYTTRVEQVEGGAEAVVRMQQDADLFDVPVTVSVEYADGARTELVVPIGERVAEARVPLTGKLKKIEVNRDAASLGIFRAGK